MIVQKFNNTQSSQSSTEHPKFTIKNLFLCKGIYFKICNRDKAIKLVLNTTNPRVFISIFLNRIQFLTLK